MSSVRSFKPGDLMVRKVSLPEHSIAIFVGFPTKMGGQQRAFCIDARGVGLFFLDAYLPADSVKPPFA